MLGDVVRLDPLPQLVDVDTIPFPILDSDYEQAIELLASILATLDIALPVGIALMIVSLFGFNNKRTQIT